MHLDPSKFKDFTPEQINCYIALSKNVQAGFFMKVMSGLFTVILISALFAAFWKNEYAFASIMAMVDGVLGAVIWRIARFYFPLRSE